VHDGLASCPHTIVCSGFEQRWMFGSCCASSAILGLHIYTLPCVCVLRRCAYARVRVNLHFLQGLTKILMTWITLPLLWKLTSKTFGTVIHPWQKLAVCVHVISRLASLLRGLGAPMKRFHCQYCVLGLYACSIVCAKCESLKHIVSSAPHHFMNTWSNHIVL
jgi:hypothetical protein